MSSTPIVKKLMSSKPLPLPAVALRSVTSKTGKGVYASSDTLFRGAVFGRDSIEVAEDLIRLRPRLVRNIIFTLASLQGEIHNDLNEEEPGKIVHEYRTAVVDGKPIDGITKHIFEELAKRWGGSEDNLTYYGSVDATPHFIRLVDRYCRLHGDKILRQKVRLRSGHVLTLKIVTENATAWLLEKLKQSQSGLLEYQRRNPHSIENQVWKDSKEFYVHENGVLANHLGPIASIEVQGLAYDALQGAATLFPNHAETYMEVAQKLRDRTLELLWNKNRQYFYLGVDFAEDGNMRILRTMTANPAALLDTSFFKDLPEEEQRRYVTAIVRTIMGRDFLTDAGVRSRALREAYLIDYWDYHGSFVSWPKETYDIAKGLRRHGFPKLARELENRIVNVVRRSRAYLEFVYVDEWGRVLASSPSASEHGEIIMVDSTNKPEAVQAWTVSAVMAIMAYKIAGRMKQVMPVRQEPWQKELEQIVMRYIPATPLYLDQRTLKARYPSYPYRLVKSKSSPSTNMPGR